jgi:hypothetical protein
MNDMQKPKGRAPRPWFRTSTQSWYVVLEGRQIRLGPDRRPALAKFRRLMKALGREVARAGTEKTPPSTSIYFIQDVETKEVKIGLSANPKARLRQIQTGHPHQLVLVRVVQGGMIGDERHLHRMLRHLHIRGEWFRGDMCIDSVIEEMINS